MQKKNYREEKKRATKELLSTITDPSVIVMADWLKVGVPPSLQSAFHVLLTSLSCNPKHSSMFDPDPRDSQKLDQAVVRAETRGSAHLQNPQKWPVGGNSAAQRLRAH